MTDVANDIRKKAYQKGISIDELCREVNVNRCWFENLKKRVPFSIEVYRRINSVLDEQGKSNYKASKS